jgi:hypothetical protein
MSGFLLVEVFAPLEKGGDKARQRLVGDLLFAPKANPPSSALRMPPPFCKGGKKQLFTGGEPIRGRA